MRRGWRMWTAAGLMLIAGTLGGAIPSQAAGTTGDGALAAAVRAVTVPASGADPVPPGFVATMGYAPVRATDAAGRAWWVRPDGGCSTPTGSTRYDFALPCKAHDLGYDLLRYARRTGHPLGGWARRAIDAAFERALDTRCAAIGGTEGCAATAATYHGVVAFNSWRQGWDAPYAEPWLPWVLVAAVLTLAPVAIEYVFTRRARGRSPS